MLAFDYDKYYNLNGTLVSGKELEAILIWAIIILIVAIAVQIWCCVVAYKMADARLQSGALWVVLALVIGWLAVIILACMPKNESNYYQSTKGRLAKLSKESEKEETNSWICDGCGWKNPITAATCKSCNQKRPKEVLERYQSQTAITKTGEESNGAWICEHCGTQNTRTYTYCKRCYKRKK